MKQLVIGILAHVDAGKTTLSEALLAVSGKIEKPGRVDNQDSYLDTFALERERGITIFSKQAVFDWGDLRFILLDTPGHVDFSAEMERTLQVLDYAILVVSGSSGIQGHTRTLWQLFARYRLPAFVFVNKMDQPGTDRDFMTTELKRHLGDGCVPFDGQHAESFYEQLALCDEVLLEDFLESGRVGEPRIRSAIRDRKVFPCYFGSALRMTGIKPLLQGIADHAILPAYPDAFGARVFKIARDEQGNRLTHMKITGGTLRTRAVLSHVGWEEKVNQIRVYSGQKFEAVQEADSGSVCAVTGLTRTRPGEGLGIEVSSGAPILEPVLSYRILLPDDCDPKEMMPKLRLVEEEEPGLHLIWDAQLQEIRALLMGEVQMEILQRIVRDRFSVDIRFDAGRIVYQETIASVVEGVGHFEPLRHYAEVHLLLEPGEPGSGLRFGADCSEDLLGRNWQRLILSHLEDKSHSGVLTGSELTDMRITLVSGRAHNKHTQGGDFWEATSRAVRQGLMEAESILLEPWYDFTLSVPEKSIGRAMHDVEGMHGTCGVIGMDGEMAELAGSAPVSTMQNYQQTLAAYSRGLGRLFCRVRGYAPCHDAEEVIRASGYDPENDPYNQTGSVFCSKGTGYAVPWNEVKEHMHLPSCFQARSDVTEAQPAARPSSSSEESISLEEIDRILDGAHHANSGRKTVWKKRTALSARSSEPAVTYSRKKETEEEYLLVDGYNVIHDWPELKALVETNLDGARIRLLDILSNYQGIRKCHVIAVFDAYRVPGRREEMVAYNNIYEVFTKEAQTADQYIERFAHVNKDRYHITVATSDGLQQMIVRSAGSALLSARELKLVIDEANEKLSRIIDERQNTAGHAIGEALSVEEKQRLHEMTEENG